VPSDSGEGRRRPPILIGAVAAIATFAAYLPGAGRSLSYDGGVTVGRFVVTPSLWDPFYRQTAENNHVLFSFLEHVVYSASGRHSDAVLRLLPMAAGAATVGLVAAALWARYGPAPAVAGSLVLAVNPMFASLSRDVRGYSLLTLCAVGSSLLLMRGLRRPTDATVLAYVVVAAAGVATHLYMHVVLLAHLGIVLARCRPRWLVRIAMAVLLGDVVYLRIAGVMWRHRGTGRFNASFPFDLVRGLVGGTWPTVVVLFPSLLIAAVLWRRRDAVAVTVPLIVALAAVWLVVQPLYLYSRFFVWLVPGIAWGVASAVRRVPWMAAVAVVAAALSVLTMRPDYRRDPLALHAGARLVDAAHAAGLRACALGFSYEPLAAYTTNYEPMFRLRGLKECDVAVWLVGFTDHRLLAAARRQFPIERRLPAVDPGYAFCRQPAPCNSLGL
jgi:Dolichyl-phosphate-mannose-protein mannosyltransferase